MVINTFLDSIHSYTQFQLHVCAQVYNVCVWYVLYTTYAYAKCCCESANQVGNGSLLWTKVKRRKVLPSLVQTWIQKMGVSIEKVSLTPLH